MCFFVSAGCSVDAAIGWMFEHEGDPILSQPVATALAPVAPAVAVLPDDVLQSFFGFARESYKMVKRSTTSELLCAFRLSVFLSLIRRLL